MCCAVAENNVEELEYSLRLEDAAWYTLEEKWIVLDPRMKIKDLAKILHGDGKTPETCFEAKFRVGGDNKKNVLLSVYVLLNMYRKNNSMRTMAILSNAGVLIDAAYYTGKGIYTVISLPYTLASWVFPKRYKRASTEDEAKTNSC